MAQREVGLHAEWGLSNKPRGCSALENKFSKGAGAVPAPTALPTYRLPLRPIHGLPRPLGKRPGRVRVQLGRDSCAASCRGLTGTAAVCGGHPAPGSAHPTPFNFLLPGPFAFIFTGMLFLFFQCPVLDIGGTEINRDPGQGLFSQRQLCPSLSLLVPPMGPLRPYISFPAKPFSLRWLLPGYVVKSLPSSNQRTSKPSFDLMPYLFSVSSAKLPSIVHTISASSLRRHRPPDPLPLLPEHTAGLRLPASLAVRCGHV